MSTLRPRLTMDDVLEATRRAANNRARETEEFRWTTNLVEALRLMEIADRTKQVRGWRKPMKFRAK